MSRDDIQAQFEALRRRVQTPRPQPTATPGRSELDAAVERVLAKREREAAAAAAEEERRRREARVVGGPCRYCGITRSRERDADTGELFGVWYSDDTCCAWCNRAREPIGGVVMSDLEHREKALRDLLPREVTRWWAPGSLPALTRFRWWSETPEAPTSPTKRFAYVNVEALTAPLADKPTEYATREPCRRCGCPSRWLLTIGGQPPVESWTCGGCRDAGDLARITSILTGLTIGSVESLGPAAPMVLGVRWWADDPAGGAADPPRPCEVPFAYVGREAAIVRAFATFAGEFESVAERCWRSPHDYARAKALAPKATSEARR